MWLVCWLNWDGEATIVHARGEIDVFTSASLEQYLRTAMIDNRARIVLDLSEVTFIDGAGLRVLERCRQDCWDQGLSFGVTQPAPHIRRLLELVDMDRVVPVLDPTPENRDDAPAHGGAT